MAELEGRETTLASLRGALATLHLDEQAAIQLVYGKGMTLAEVARETGAHVNTAKNRHMSALRKLREILVERGAMGL